MEPLVIARKTLRALLNDLRECCLYREKIGLNRVEGALTCCQLIEQDSRDLAEEKTLVVEGESFDERVEIVLTYFDEAYLLEGVRVDVQSGKSFYKIKIEDVSRINRRRSRREVVQESHFIPVQIRNTENQHYTLPGFVRAVDYDDGVTCFDLMTPNNVDRESILNSTLIFQRDTFPGVEAEVRITSVRKIGREEHFGGHLTRAQILAATTLENRVGDADAGAIALKKETYIDLVALLRKPLELGAQIARVTKNGLVCSVSPQFQKQLPLFFVSEVSGTGVRFNSYRSSNELTLTLVSNEVGIRAQWYNFLAELVMGVQARFLPSDVDEITRLMLESGNYAPKAMSNIVTLQEFLKTKWPLESGYAKTKFRWLVRDEGGLLLGHTAGLRVSERLWAAIDNIGSQSNRGSWNGEIVSRWIRAFSELLLHSESENSVVQWTYNPKAGVWNKFGEFLENNKELVEANDCIWSYFVDNYEQTKRVSRSLTLEYLGTSFSEVRRRVSTEDYEGRKILELLNLDSSEKSPFLSAFENEYGCRLVRHYALLKFENSEQAIVTFSNYPTWASLNKTHDWIYVLPRKGNDKSLVEKTDEIIEALRELVFEKGGTPFRIGIVDNTNSYSKWTKWINLMIRPKALEFAALVAAGEV